MKKDDFSKGSDLLESQKKNGARQAKQYHDNVFKAAGQLSLVFRIQGFSVSFVLGTSCTYMYTVQCNNIPK